MASSFKNSGGNYNNANLKKVLEATGNEDIASGGGVGDKDVQTLGAITAAIKRGTLDLGDIFGADGKDKLGANSINAGDKVKYDAAIEAVLSGNLGANIAGVNNNTGTDAIRDLLASSGLAGSAGTAEATER